MIEFPNGNKYKLIYLDTNVINEIAKNTRFCGKNFWKNKCNDYMYVTSAFNIYELSKAKNESRNKIIEIFDIIPLGVISTFPQLLEFEEINPKFDYRMIMFATGMKPLFNTQFHDMIKICDTPETRNYIELMQTNIRNEIDECNIFRDTCKIKDTNKRVNKIIENTLDKYNKRYIKSKYRSLEVLSSIKDKFIFVKKDEITQNSVIDYWNTSVLPYVDEYITERTVASWINELKIKYDYLKDKKIYKISEFFN